MILIDVTLFFQYWVLTEVYTIFTLASLLYEHRYVFVPNKDERKMLAFREDQYVPELLSKIWTAVSQDPKRYGEYCLSIMSLSELTNLVSTAFATA